MSGIVVILLLTVLIPVIAFNVLPEWVYYAVPATRLWLATEQLSTVYGTDSFLDAIRSLEKKNDSSVELYTASGRFVYSTRAFIDELPTELSKAKTIDKKYHADLEVKYGEILPGEKNFLIKTYTQGQQRNRMTMQIDRTSIR